MNYIKFLEELVEEEKEYLDIDYNSIIVPFEDRKKEIESIEFLLKENRRLINELITNQFIEEDKYV